jgi:guanylate kinase
LRARGTEDAASLARRLANARREMERIGEYDYVVVNDDLEGAVARLRELLARQFSE